MVLLLGKLYDLYNFLNEDFKDPRTQHFPLMSNPFPVLLILTCYNMFVRRWGPRLMAKRKPFNLDKIIIAFNIFQVVANLYVFIKGYTLGWGSGYSFWCEPLDHSDTPHTKQVVSAVYFYFWLKVIDLLDTVFFVLRKKNSQVSFLHLYHHTGMVVLSWSAVKWVPGGHNSFIGWINSPVHIVMYSYYLVSTLRPEYKKNIWWKKHITQLQMLQFFLNILHSVALLVSPDCGYPRFTPAIFIPQNTFMLVLFYDFYKKAYLNKKIKTYVLFLLFLQS